MVLPCLIFGNHFFFRWVLGCFGQFLVTFRTQTALWCYPAGQGEALDPAMAALLDVWAVIGVISPGCLAISQGSKYPGNVPGMGHETHETRSWAKRYQSYQSMKTNVFTTLKAFFGHWGHWGHVSLPSWIRHGIQLRPIWLKGKAATPLRTRPSYTVDQDGQGPVCHIL